MSTCGVDGCRIHPDPPTIDWGAVREVDLWLDQGAAQVYRDQPLAQDWARISKIGEELGEAIQAFIGFTGQNPRKGHTHSLDDVLKELADTVVTGIYAIQHFTNDTKETEQIIRTKLESIHKRMRSLNATEEADEVDSTMNKIRAALAKPAEAGRIREEAQRVRTEQANARSQHESRVRASNLARSLARQRWSQPPDGA